MHVSLYAVLQIQAPQQFDGELRAESLSVRREVESALQNGTPIQRLETWPDDHVLKNSWLISVWNWIDGGAGDVQ